MTDADPPARFGLPTATFIVIASMVGGGVLTTSGFTARATESNAWMLILWVVGGVLAVCGALCIAELAASLPRSGGDYVFLYEAYGPLPAFLSGWVSFVMGFGGPIAVSAYGAAKYLVAPAGLEGAAAWRAEVGLATALIVAFGLIHCLGHGPSKQAQGWSTALKVAILAALAAAGIVAGRGRWANLADLGPVAPDRLIPMFYSLVYITYAFTGWNAAGYVAGEVHEPRRNVPRSILLGTGLVLVLYLAMNLFYALALTPADLGEVVRAAGGEEGAVAPIGELAATRLFGPRVSAPVSIALGLTLMASVSAFVLTGPRVAYAMARAGHFPAIAGRVWGRTGAPAAATALQVGWSLVLLWTGTFEGIFVYSSVGLALFSMLTISSVYALRIRRPDLPRPFRTPGYPLVPAVYLVATGLLTAAVFWERKDVSLYALASILAGVPVYYLLARRRGRKPEAPGG